MKESALAVMMAFAAVSLGCSLNAASDPAAEAIPPPAEVTAEASEPELASQSAQVWTGVLPASARPLRVELHVTSTEAGEYAAELVSLDQGDARRRVDQITISDGVMAFTIAEIGGYEGTLDEAGTVADGRWTQNDGRQLPLRLTRAATAP